MNSKIISNNRSALSDSSKSLYLPKRKMLAVALAPLIAYSTPLFADQGSVLEEVFITAQKRAQSLQDVGISVTAFSGDQMRELGQVDAKDIALQTPGVTFVDAGQS